MQCVYIIRSITRLVVTCAVLAVVGGTAGAQTKQGVPQTKPSGPLGGQPASIGAVGNDPDETWAIPDRGRINDGTVTVITAPAGGATSVFGSDMARVLDNDGDRGSQLVRVLPVLGKGPVRNVIDVLYLKSIDMGAVAVDVPEFYKLQYKIPDVASRLRYIAKLYNNELHVIAPASIKTIFDLEGKRVVAQTDVGYYSAKVIFSRLGIHATFDYKTDDAQAIQRIVDGQADGYITSTGKIFQLARNIKNENGALHLVPIPHDGRLQDLYEPATLSSDEYPNLLSPGETIDTVAASVLLVSFNWPEDSERYKRVARFVDAFFSKIAEFRKPPRHPKWKESSITVVVPGWQRFKAADEWLDRNGVKTAEAVRSAAPTSQEFLRFMQSRSGERALSSEDLERLYQEFLDSRRPKQ